MRTGSFPFFAGRFHTPELASPEEMAALHQALHIERMVIMTPSVYGPDNSATLFGIKARGPTARGVAVIDDQTRESDLDALHQAGFRGIRLNLATGGVSDPAVGRPRLQAALDRVKGRAGMSSSDGDAAPLARALIAANPERIVWCTDWPHPNSMPDNSPTEVTPLFQIDDGRLFNQLPVWAADVAIRR